MLYLDNAATTPLLPEVRKVMINYMVDNFGNPSSIYKIGRMNKIAVEEARKSIAETIGACPDDIFFTSGGTESDNWVLESAAESATESDSAHIIVYSLRKGAVMWIILKLIKMGLLIPMILYRKYVMIQSLYQ